MGRREAEYVRCTPKACDARLALTEQELTAWKQARSAELLYRPNPTVPPIRFDVSLMGISAAFSAALEAKE